MKRTVVIALLAVALFSVALAQEKNPDPQTKQPETKSQTLDKKSDMQDKKTIPSAQMDHGNMAQQGPVEQELIKLDQEWSQAGIGKDTSVYERVMADDYSAIDPTGKAIGKAEAIANMKADTTKLESNTTDDYKVRMYGDVAVLTHSGVRKGQRDGQAFTEGYRSMHVFVKRGGRWQAVATQSTPVRQQ